MKLCTVCGVVTSRSTGRCGEHPRLSGIGAIALALAPRPDRHGRAPSATASRLPVAFYPRKNNLGALPPEQGLTLTFEGDGGPIRIERSDVADSAELGARLPAHVRIRAALKHGPLSYAEIAEAVGESFDTVRMAIKRAGDAFVRVEGSGLSGLTRWGNAA